MRPFIAVKKDKNKDYNMCISQSHLLQEFLKFYEEFLLKKLDDFGILQEFFMNSSAICFSDKIIDLRS